MDKEQINSLKELAENVTPGRLPMLERLPEVNSKNISEFIGVLLRNQEKLIKSNSQLINDNMRLIGLVEHLEKEADWLAAKLVCASKIGKQCDFGEGCICKDCKNATPTDWRTAARKAVAERSEQSDIEPR